MKLKIGIIFLALTLVNLTFAIENRAVWIGASEYTSCAILEDKKTAICWGEVKPSEAGGLDIKQRSGTITFSFNENIRQIYFTYMGYLVLYENGNLSLLKYTKGGDKTGYFYERNANNKTKQEIQFKEIFIEKKVNNCVGSGKIFCYLKDKNAKCFKEAINKEYQSIFDSSSFSVLKNKISDLEVINLTSSGDTFCVSTTDLRVYCQDEKGNIILNEQKNNLKDFALTWNKNLYYITKNNELVYPNGNRKKYPDNLKQIIAGLGYVCVLTGIEVKCFEYPNSGISNIQNCQNKLKRPINLSNKPAIMLAGGKLHACLLSPDRNIYCIGCDPYGAGEVPSGIINIIVPKDFVCALCDNRFVNVVGDTMEGDLSMGNYSLTNAKKIETNKLCIGEICISSFDEIKTKCEECDNRFVNVAGDIMEGDLNMNAHNIIGINYLNASNICIDGICISSWNEIYNFDLPLFKEGRKIKLKYNSTYFSVNPLGELTFNYDLISNDLSQYQRRITGICTGNKAIQKVNEDGSVECKDFLTYGDIHTLMVDNEEYVYMVSVSPTLKRYIYAKDTELFGGKLPREYQLRIKGSCTGNKAIQKVNEDGSVECIDTTTCEKCDNRFVNVAGDIMEGDLNMGGYNITNSNNVETNKLKTSEICMNGACISSFDEIYKFKSPLSQNNQQVELKYNPTYFSVNPKGELSLNYKIEEITFLNPTIDISCNNCPTSFQKDLQFTSTKSYDLPKGGILTISIKKEILSGHSCELEFSKIGSTPYATQRDTFTVIIPEDTSGEIKISLNYFGYNCKNVNLRYTIEKAYLMYYG